MSSVKYLVIARKRTPLQAVASILRDDLSVALRTKALKLITKIRCHARDIRDIPRKSEYTSPSFLSIQHSVTQNSHPPSPPPLVLRTRSKQHRLGSWPFACRIFIYPTLSMWRGSMVLSVSVFNKSLTHVGTRTHSRD